MWTHCSKTLSSTGAEAVAPPVSRFTIKRRPGIKHMSLTVCSVHILLQLAVEAELRDDPGTQLGELRWGGTFVHCRFQGSIFQHVALVPAVRRTAITDWKENTQLIHSFCSAEMSCMYFHTCVCFFFPPQDHKFFSKIKTSKWSFIHCHYSHSNVPLVGDALYSTLQHTSFIRTSVSLCIEFALTKCHFFSLFFFLCDEISFLPQNWMTLLELTLSQKKKRKKDPFRTKA